MRLPQHGLPNRRADAAPLAASSGLGTLPLAAIAAVTLTELPGIIRRMEERQDSLGGRWSIQPLTGRMTSR
jgi:hypothetical protein